MIRFGRSVNRQAPASVGCVAQQYSHRLYLWKSDVTHSSVASWVARKGKDPYLRILFVELSRYTNSWLPWESKEEYTMKVHCGKCGRVSTILSFAGQQKTRAWTQLGKTVTFEALHRCMSTACWKQAVNSPVNSSGWPSERSRIRFDQCKKCAAFFTANQTVDGVILLLCTWV